MLRVARSQKKCLSQVHLKNGTKKIAHFIISRGKFTSETIPESLDFGKGNAFFFSFFFLLNLCMGNKFTMACTHFLICCFKISPTWHKHAGNPAAMTQGGVTEAQGHLFPFSCYLCSESYTSLRSSNLCLNAVF